MTLETRLLPGEKFTRVGDMTWPSVTHLVGDIAWRIAHCPDALTRADMLVAAKVIDAYLQMVNLPASKRNAVCAALKRAANKLPEEIEK